jgi:hypothetical protein
LYQPAADVTGVEATLVESIVSFYWGEVKKAMIEGQAHNIMLHNLGTFTARPDKVQGLIDKYNRNLLYIQPTTFQRCHVIQEIKKRIETLQCIQISINEDKIKKQLVKEKRNGKRI